MISVRTYTYLTCRVLREYLKEETFVEEISAEFDLERVVDDFVLLCVLVGNDFLPHSPTLDINEGAMDQIFDCYREMLRKKEGYLTYGEAISHIRLGSFLSQVALHETDTLKQRAQVCNYAACFQCAFPGLYKWS